MLFIRPPYPVDLMMFTKKISGTSPRPALEQIQSHCLYFTEYLLPDCLPQ